MKLYTKQKLIEINIHQSRLHQGFTMAFFKNLLRGLNGEDPFAALYAEEAIKFIKYFSGDANYDYFCSKHSFLIRCFVKSFYDIYLDTWHMNSEEKHSIHKNAERLCDELGLGFFGNNEDLGPIFSRFTDIKLSSDLKAEVNAKIEISKLGIHYAQAKLQKYKRGSESYRNGYHDVAEAIGEGIKYWCINNA
jgi:hypothetical protein